MIFTSESVCSGHPDKICDAISDAIVDEVLRQDKNGRVAVEALVTKNRCILAGEVTTLSHIDYEKIVRKQIHDLGYTNPMFQFTDLSPINIFIHEQSPEIAKGVDKKGAGDQGIMFGFACNETKQFMPAAILIAHRLAQQIDIVRESNLLPYLFPDGKTQVTIKYNNNKPIEVLKIVLAVPHKESITLREVKHDLFNFVVSPVLEEFGFSLQESKLIVNGTGVWHRGGPASDTGLTGRKIVVDTYGGCARVGGGALSGKDPTKVDRTGAYGARFIAKNIVANGLAEKAEVRLAYCIGGKKPLMQEIETFDTEKVSSKAIKDFSNRLIDTSVFGIIERLNLLQPIYRKTSCYGHFGRDIFPWEKIVNI